MFVECSRHLRFEKILNIYKASVLEILYLSFYAEYSSPHMQSMFITLPCQNDVAEG